MSNEPGTFINLFTIDPQASQIAEEVRKREFACEMVECLKGLLEDVGYDVKLSITEFGGPVAIATPKEEN